MPKKRSPPWCAFRVIDRLGVPAICCDSPALNTREKVQWKHAAVLISSADEQVQTEAQE